MFTRLFAVSLLAAYLSLAFATGLEPVSVQLKWQHQFQFAGFYAARELGLYEQAGFDVTLYALDPSSTTVLERVVSGEVTFGVADSTIALHRLNGQPVVVLASIFQHSPLVFITRARDQFQSPYELIGKRLMFQRNADDAALLAMLTKMNIRSDQYDFIPSNLDNLALRDHSISAMSGYITNQPFQYHQAGIETRIIDPANYGINFYGDLLYARQDYVESNPQRAQAFKQATLEGWKYALDHPEHVIEWIIRDYAPDKTIAELEYEAAALVPIIAAHLVPLGTTNRFRFNRIAEIYQQLNMAPIDGSLEGLLLEDYLKRTNEMNPLSPITMVLAVILLAGFVIFALLNKRLQSIVRHRTQQLRESHEELAFNMAIINHHALVVYCDVNWQITSVSSAMAELFGYSQSELLASHLTRLKHPDESDLLLQTINATLEDQQQWRGELMCQHSTGNTVWLDARVNIRRELDSKKPGGYIVTCFDVTDRKLLEKLSETDPLTELANRRKADTVLYHEWARHLRYKEQFSIILVDIDHFKSINDQHGHLEGDRVLTKVAQLIRQTIRQIDTVARWGGEEFIIVCPNTHELGAQWLAEKLRNTISDSHLLNGHPITASFGIAATALDCMNLDQLIKQADDALYEAKHSGRNRVQVFKAAG